MAYPEAKASAFVEEGFFVEIEDIYFDSAEKFEEALRNVSSQQSKIQTPSSDQPQLPAFVPAPT